MDKRKGFRYPMIKAHHHKDSNYYFVYEQGWDKIDEIEGFTWDRVPTRDSLRIHSKDLNTVVLVRPHFGEIEITGSTREAALLLAAFVRDQLNMRQDYDSIHYVPLKKIFQFLPDWQINDDTKFVEEYNRIIRTVLLLS